MLKIEELKPSDLNCNVFSAYDYDGLTMQELLCQFFTKINECITTSNKTIELANYLVNEGLSKEVTSKLMVWLSDGTLEELINKTVFEGLNLKIEDCEIDIAQIRNEVIIINDTMSIDTINEKLKNSGTFIFKNGEYLLTSDKSINVCSNSHITFEPKAFIKQITPNSTHYVLLNVENCENVVIDYPIIYGCKKIHVGDSGEWGYGIEVASSKNIIINKPQIYDCWGDGLYIGYKWNSINNLFKTDNIVIDKPYIQNCRRNGISVCSGDNIKIYNPRIYDIKGTAPEMGIDIEPENSNKSVIHLNNLYIEQPITENCGTGIGVIAYNVLEGSVTINNHRDYKSTSSFQYGGVVDEVWETNYTNPLLYPLRNGITIRNKGLNSKLKITNIEFLGKGNTPNGADYSSDYMVHISNKDCINKNIIIDGLKFISKDDVKFPYSLVVINSNGHLNDFNVSNVILDGVPMYLDENVNLYNINNVFKSNYYLQTMTSITLYSGHLYTNISAHESKITINRSLPNGEYDITVLGSDIGASLTVDKQDGVTFLPTNEKKTLSQGRLKFYKNGNNVVFM